MRSPRFPSRTRSAIASMMQDVIRRSVDKGRMSKYCSITLVTGRLAPQLTPTNSMARKAPPMCLRSGVIISGRRSSEQPLSRARTTTHGLVTDAAIGIDVRFLRRYARLDDFVTRQAEIQNGLAQRFLQIEMTAGGQLDDTGMEKIVIDDIGDIVANRPGGWRQP